MLTIVNKSTKVTTEQAQLITRACAAQLKEDVGPLWGKVPSPVVFSSTPKDAAPGSTVLFLSDSIDDAQALGYHTELPGDVESAIIGVEVILSQPGSSVLDGEMSVAAVTSHEVCEWFIDPHCNLFADTGHGYAIAVEVCDPVESDAYTLNVYDAHTRKWVPVGVSNFVKPSWFDPSAGHGPHDYMGKISAPFAMDAGGYYVKLAEGRASQVFGEHYPAWRKQLKDRPTGRGKRLITRTTG